MFEIALVGPGALTQQDQLETLPARGKIPLEATAGLYNSTALNCASHGNELTKSSSLWVFSVFTSIQTYPTLPFPPSPVFLLPCQ